MKTRLIVIGGLMLVLVIGVGWGARRENLTGLEEYLYWQRLHAYPPQAVHLGYYLERYFENSSWVQMREAVLTNGWVLVVGFFALWLAV